MGVAETKELVSKENIIQRYKQVAKDQRHVAVRSVGGLVTGAALGFATGYGYGEVKGIPVGPVVGIMAHVYGFTQPYKSENAQFAHTVGDTCLAVYAFNFAREVAEDKAAKT